MDKEAVKRHFKKLGVELKDEDIVELDDNTEADVIYDVEDDEEEEVKGVIKFLAYLLTSTLAVPALAVVFALAFFNAVPEDVYGKSFSFGKYSFVPKSYELEYSSLKEGDRVIYVSSRESSFVLREYYVGEVKQVGESEVSVYTGESYDRVKIHNILYKMR